MPLISIPFIKRSIYLFLVCSVLVCCSGLKQNQKSGNGDKGGTGSQTPITKFTISTTRMELGDTAWLTWDIEAADSILLDGNMLTLPFPYKLAVTPDTFTTYTMTIFRKDEVPKKRKVSVDVYQPKVTFFNALDTANDELDITLEWRARNALYVMIDGVEGKQKLSGTLKIRKDTTTHFVVRAVGKFYTDTLSKTTRIRLVEKVKYNKPVYSGEYFPIDFAFKRADSVSIEGIDSVYKPSDRAIVKLYESGPLVFTIFRIYRQEEQRFENIDILSPQIKISGSKTLIKGETGIVSWNVRGGDSIRFDNGKVNLLMKGQISMTPANDTSITFIVYNGRDILPEIFFIKVVPYRKYVGKTKSFKAVKPDERIDMRIFHASADSFPNAIKLDVFVYDTAGNYIAGIINNQAKVETGKKLFGTLTERVDNKPVKKDFQVIEKDTSFKSVSNIVFVADYGLMDNDYLNIINNALIKTIATKDKEDKVSVIEYGQGYKVLYGLQHEANTLKDSLSISQTLWNGGGSCMYAAVDKACSILEPQSGEKAIVLITTRNDNQSLFFSEDHLINESVIAKNLCINNIRFFVICVSSSINLDLMQGFVDQVGGILYYVPDMQKINAVLTEIQLLQHNYYQIRYVPENIINKSHTADLRYINRNFGTTLTSISYDISDAAGYENYLSDVDSNAYWFDCVKGKKVICSPQAVAFFGINSDSIVSKYYKNLDVITNLLAKNTNYSVLLVGHSDLSGTDVRCDEISKLRTLAVENYLMNKGINKSRIVSYYKGKSAPVWSDETLPWQAAENRRVEVILISR